jgi:purine catabolism regulator
MSITVRDLLSFSHLGLSVRAGRAGLDRVVTWAHISEQDPTESLSLDGGELLVSTGLGVPREAAEQVRYLRHLASRGAAGLAVTRNNGVAPPRTRAMTREADGLGLPLLDIAVGVAFKDIVSTVVSANGAAGEQRLVKQLRIFDTLRLDRASALSAPDLFARLTQASGYDLYVSSPAGVPFFEGVPPVPGQYFAALQGEGRRSPSIEGGYLLPLEVAGREAAWLAAIARDAAPSGGLATAQHIATVAVVRVAERYQGRETRRRRGEQLFSALLTERLDRFEVARRLAEAGISANETVVVIAVQPDAPERTDVTEVHHRACDLGIESLVASRRHLMVLAPATERFDQLLELLSTDCVLGVSRAFSRGTPLLIACREATVSLEAAQRRHERVVQFSPTEAALAWLPVEPDALSSVVDAILGPVISYDKANDTQLVESLHVLLAHDRRLGEAARTLQVHQHTLAYRMRTVERLTGRKLNRIPDLVDLFLGLRALGALESERPEVLVR